MKKIAPVVMIAFALLFLLLMYSDNSYARLSLLKENIELQRKRNSELNMEVMELKEKVYNLQNSSRELEKAARNKLGMARPDEEIFIFDKK